MASERSLWDAANKNEIEGEGRRAAAYNLYVSIFYMNIKEWCYYTYPWKLRLQGDDTENSSMKHAIRTESRPTTLRSHGH